MLENKLIKISQKTDVYVFILVPMVTIDSLSPFSTGRLGGEHGGKSGGVPGRYSSDHLPVYIDRRLWWQDLAVVLCEFHQSLTRT